MALFGLGRRRDARVAGGERRRQVEDWARRAGGFGPETVLKAGEVVCPDPACPGDETVILILRPGAHTRAVKIAMPLGSVSEADVAAALAADPLP